MFWSFDTFRHSTFRKLNVSWRITKHIYTIFLTGNHKIECLGAKCWLCTGEKDGSGDRVGAVILGMLGTEYDSLKHRKVLANRQRHIPEEENLRRKFIISQVHQIKTPNNL